MFYWPTTASNYSLHFHLSPGENLTSKVPTPEKSNAELVLLTVKIVTTFASQNTLTASSLTRLIEETFRSLGSLQARSPVGKLVPAVPISQSIQPGFLICLEDGRKFKTLKGHLRKLGMTPTQYRAKWGLPSDYPMVAAEHSANRSRMAKSWSLGGPLYRSREGWN